MRKFLSIILSILLILTLTACGNTASENSGNGGESNPAVSDAQKYQDLNNSSASGETGGTTSGNETDPGSGTAAGSQYGVAPIIPAKPATLMTDSEYHAKVDALTSSGGFENVNSSYATEMDTLRNNLIAMIAYNSDSAKISGTAYYVSNKGNDNNDGKTPATAWATLDKVNTAELKPGDGVFFERGGLWRGGINAKKGVTYSAYGSGDKPRIFASIDGKTHGEWKQTSTPNVWVLDKVIDETDCGTIVFNDGEYFANKKQAVEKLVANFDFVYTGNKSDATKVDRKIYLYYDKGNPAECFKTIDIASARHLINFFEPNLSDVTIHNLDLAYGQDYYFTSNLKNITMSYCTVRWCGGAMFQNQDIRAGGGGGAWENCDGLYFDHCYFYQHFDAGVSPQYQGSNPCVYKKFQVTNCVFEKIEWVFEHWISVSEQTAAKSRWIDCKFAYNICYDTGGGFGDKMKRSSCVIGKAGAPVENCVIEKNIFDRSWYNSIIIDSNSSNSNDKYHFELKNNLYVIGRANVTFATIWGVGYKATAAGFADFVKLGIESNPTMKYINK